MDTQVIHSGMLCSSSIDEAWGHGRGQHFQAEPAGHRADRAERKASRRAAAAAAIIQRGREAFDAERLSRFQPQPHYWGGEGGLLVSAAPLDSAAPQPPPPPATPALGDHDPGAHPLRPPAPAADAAEAARAREDEEIEREEACLRRLELQAERIGEASRSSEAARRRDSTHSMFLFVFSGVMLLFLLEQFLQIGIHMSRRQAAAAAASAAHALPPMWPPAPQMPYPRIV